MPAYSQWCHCVPPPTPPPPPSPVCRGPGGGRMSQAAPITPAQNHRPGSSWLQVEYVVGGGENHQGGRGVWGGEGGASSELRYSSVTPRVKPIEGRCLLFLLLWFCCAPPPPPTGSWPSPNQRVFSSHRLPVLRPEARGCGARHEGTTFTRS